MCVKDAAGQVDFVTLCHEVLMSRSDTFVVHDREAPVNFADLLWLHIGLPTSDQVGQKLKCVSI